MKSVLSVQSHVTHGYVGGKAAIFPLQCRGWEVDNIDTVQFSNHTGYGSFMGRSTTSEVVELVFQGLNDIDVKYDAVITGYIPLAPLIELICGNIRKLKEKKPDMIYLLDPVMGDHGCMYVNESCTLMYKKILHEHFVDIITPNQYELELLTNSTVRTKQDLIRSVGYLHEIFHIRYVVVTSLENFEFKNKDNVLYCAVSDSKSGKRALFEVPVIKSYFTGVGDLFSALLLDRLYDLTRNGEDETTELELWRAIIQVLNIMLKTLHLTRSIGIENYKQNQTSNGKQVHDIESHINDKSMKFFELKVVQAKSFFSYEGMDEFSPIYY